MQSRIGAMVPFFEDDDDPKKSRPVRVAKKREMPREHVDGWKDDDYDRHRHVNVSC